MLHRPQLQHRKSALQWNLHSTPGPLTTRLRPDEGQAPPAANGSRKSKGPQGPKKPPQPQGRGSPGGHLAAGAAGATRAAARPSRRPGPRTHTRSRHSTLAGSGGSPPHCPAAEKHAGRGDFRPARAPPDHSARLARSRSTQIVSGAPGEAPPSPPSPQLPAGLTKNKEMGRGPAEPHSVSAILPGGQATPPRPILN
ncbi:hypothetical protein NDU88_003598 [Pleurodeles waltl]|uniref:Uncharacterized protein n=1 Tax=Pleurodeles waltl TaxID=8319 RepID=A0AAV7UGL1_PLEWA|nr:hypothetical protein NDU88_003598 [Pleurodeles waltl]